MRKKGEKGAPKASDFERAAQTAKENVQEGPEDDEAREAKRNAVRMQRKKLYITGRLKDQELRVADILSRL